MIVDGQMVRSLGDRCSKIINVAGTMTSDVVNILFAWLEFLGVLQNDNDAMTTDRSQSSVAALAYHRCLVQVEAVEQKLGLWADS